MSLTTRSVQIRIELLEFGLLPVQRCHFVEAQTSELSIKRVFFFDALFLLDLGIAKDVLGNLHITERVEQGNFALELFFVGDRRGTVTAKVVRDVTVVLAGEFFFCGIGFGNLLGVPVIIIEDECCKSLAFVSESL